MEISAVEKLKVKTKNNLHICVGLDTDIRKIPEYLKKSRNPILEFNKIVIENTAPCAAAYKINFAFYEKDGLNGIENLIRTIELIPKDVLLIADAKRGDIDNTSLMYAESVFNHFKCDAVTLHPYMGHDSLEPFLNYRDKISFVLALTSNSGASDFEKLKLDDGSFLFQRTIKKVNEWNINQNCGIVFGATKHEELVENINLFNDLFVLLPGVGAQGGKLEDVVEVFEKNNNNNYIINVSRALIYCDSTSEFPQKIKNEIEQLNLVVRRVVLKNNNSI